MYGLQGKVEWKLHRQIKRGVRYMCTTLRAYASSMGLKSTTTAPILKSPGSGEAIWTSFPAGIDGDVCDLQKQHSPETLHGRKRLEMWKAATGYTSWVEIMHERDQTGKII